MPASTIEDKVQLGFASTLILIGVNRPLSHLRPGYFVAPPVHSEQMESLIFEAPR